MTSSSSSFVKKSFKYDVFLSFSGEDTRKTFVDHLRLALVNKGIITYKDDETIEKGERIDDQLIRSIEESRFYIIVFSKNYAGSSWCLQELSKIMECQKTKEQTAYPVFYDVEPTEVRKQTGAVGEAFAKHVQNPAAGKWRDALKEASGLAGWELKNTADGHEAKFIQKIVKQISLKLHIINWSIDEKLVGMEERVKNVISSLEVESEDDVRIIGIWGMGGAGKTTLARAVFDHISIWFEGYSFVENVRECSKGSLSGLKKLQKQVLKDVLNDQSIGVTSVSDGIEKMKKMMPGRKVLVVLDDVDDTDQLEALAGNPNWFKPGSRIIITTRDKHVLIAQGVNVDNIYNISLLSHEEAICLFSRHAFSREVPNQGYAELSNQVVYYAKGLPLTIKVLGSFLCGKTEWVDTLERLKTIPLKKTLEKLEISYDGLEKDEKEIFLDVACILKGELKDDAIRMLESCGFHARIGLEVLEQKSLINVKYNIFLGMHDHIEEMGKNIVRRLHPDKPNRHSRLWVKKEIEEILVKDLGTEATRSMVLKNPDIHPAIFMKGLRKMKELRFLCVYGFNFSKEWEIDEDVEYLPDTLQSLHWSDYPLCCLPKTFQANNLVNLKMPWSYISQLWEGGEKKVLEKLKFVNLSYSKLRTFDLGMTRNIETLDLSFSNALAELQIPVELPKLKYLNLSDSKVSNLNLGMTPNIENLRLARCKELVELQMPVALLMLKELDVSHSKMSNLNLVMAPNIKVLSLDECHNLVELQMRFTLTMLNSSTSIILRGEDTHKTFVVEKIVKGDRIDDQLLRSIEESRSCIIVFSKNHTCSSWYLQKIVECHKTKEHTACRVFYDVGPTKVLNQSVAVGEAFAKHIENEPTGKLKDAMKEVSNLAGWDWGEAKFFKIIVREILLTLHVINLSIDEKLVDIGERVKNVISSLEVESEDDVRVIGIWGMGGAGKTTLARAVFDHISIVFEGKSFVENVRECSKGMGLKELQKQVLKDVLNDQSIDVTSVSDGINKMKKMMAGRKVLVVLDDVDDIDQLEALAGNLNWFKPGSRIIITTRDKQVLKAHGVRDDNIYSISLLSDEEAIFLFSKYAFRMKLPIHGYEKLTRKVVHYAAGLPLTIKVLGSLFYDIRDRPTWVDTLKRLKIIPLNETLKILEISYDSLEEDQKEIFLDVACILKGEPKENAIRILESCGFHAQNGLKVLEQKSLINISSYGCLGMHDHIEEMGRNIVCGLNPREPNKQSRLWVKEEIEEILINDLGTKATKSMILKDMDIHPAMVMKGLRKMKNIIFLSVNRYLSPKMWEIDEGGVQYLPDTLRSLIWVDYPFFCLPKTFQANNLVYLKMPRSYISQLWEGGERKVLKRLKFVDLSYSKLRTFDLGMTRNLETLDLHSCKDLVELQIPVPLPMLKVLDLSGSKVSNLNLGMTPNIKNISLKGCKDLVELQIPVPLPMLKDLDLSGSKVSNLNVGMTPNIENLCLEGCEDLVELQMLVALLRLKDLHLTGYKVSNLNLGISPNLQVLELKDCNYLKEILVLGRLKHLTRLNLSGCLRFEYFWFYTPRVGLQPMDLGGLECLEELNLSYCVSLRSIPDSICQLKCLKELDLSHCRRVEKLPEELGRVECLKELKIEGAGISRLPESIFQLKDLRIIGSAGIYTETDTEDTASGLQLHS